MEKAKVARKSEPDGRIYQIKIVLKDTKPPIWRRVQMADGSLEELHRVIQKAMGWEDDHLHSFTIGGSEYAPPNRLGTSPFSDDSEESTLDHTLGEFVPASGKCKFKYLYDFGDSWLHEIAVEKVQEADPETKYPICTAGARRCPPEDCGGTWGYASLQEIHGDPEHEEYEYTREWLGDDFDPGEFDAGETTLRMSR